MKKVIEREDIEEFAQDFCEKLQPKEGATVVALSGDLGSGKTTFTQSVGTYFGIKEPITSPTFVIQKTYPLTNKPFDKLVHIDAYRLEDSEDIKSLGWDKLLLDSKTIIFIEWPEKIKDAIPENAHCLSFAHLNETAREITYTHNG